MPNPVNICSLDYLIGTIATAYKGMITSLVAKDFCITDRDGEITLKGSILSIPEGRYQARLMHEGSELARTLLRDGYFELKVPGDVVKPAKNLQIDVVQNGRHIGTFLLKRERKGEFFYSATELSEELRGMDLKQLTANIQGRIGLLKKAEDIVSKILSPKKDWKKFSEEIHGFASDIFWAERDTFYGSYTVLVRYSRLACEKLGEDKSLSNFLSLIELPIEKESEEKSLRILVRTWLNELEGSGVDLALRPNHCRRVLESIREKFPGTDTGFALKMLLSGLKKRISQIPTLGDKVFLTLKGSLPDSDYDLLTVHGEERKEELLRDIADMERLTGKGRYKEFFERSGRIHSALRDETDAVRDFFTLIEKNIRPETEEKIVAALILAIEDFRTSSAEVSRKAAAGTVGFMLRLIDLGLAGTCETLLNRLGSEDFIGGQDLVLDPELARVIVHAGEEDLLRVFKDVLRNILIPSPGISGFSTDTWAEIPNPLHIDRIRKFMRIIALDSVRFGDVLVHVICNLFVSGVFIPDERLFQREISAYLNSGNFADNFLLNHLLLQRLPVYFNEVGATGRIRDYTTEIDSWGNDTVLYFLRKQVHVNASNYNVRLIVKIMQCWVSADPSVLKGVVPDDVLQKLDKGLLSNYSSAIRPFFESLGLLKEDQFRPEGLLGVKEEELRRRLEAADAKDETRSKILLLCRIYQEVTKKYSAAATDEEEGNIYEKLPQHIEKMKDLKKIIVSPEKTRPQEALYFKRHIAFGIPSVMGSYHEPKFNAFGELLRNEEKVRVLLEKISAATGTRGRDTGTRDLERWTASLPAVNDLFHILGLDNFQVDEIIAIFHANSLYTSQIADMLRLWQKELTWMAESLHRTFYPPLTGILDAFPQADLPERLRGIDSRSRDFTGKAANIIMRDILGSLTGPVELDNILDNLVTLLKRPSKDERIDEARRQAAAEKEFLALDELGEDDAMNLGPLIGAKAKNLVYMNVKGLPVPSGVVFLSRGNEDYREYTESTGFAATLKRAVRRIEEKAGAFFGGLERPLFLSVRSGSYISMPGILSSILYCGMNRKTIDAYIALTGDSGLVWDSYRRFLFHYGAAVHSVDARVFEDIARDFLGGKGFERIEDMPAEDTRKLAGLYLEELERRGLPVPEDVYEQLKEAVKAVYRSWHSVRAAQFRKALNVSEHWGTSVTLMEMVPGNAAGAGASVFFTRNPSTLEKGVYGETKERGTGDDLVSGGLINRPITRDQALDGQNSLEETDPELFSLHLYMAGRVEEAMRGLPQEVEATYVTSPAGKRVIYVLQTRRTEFQRGFTKRFQDVCRMEESIIGRGTGIHGGALSGLATFASSPAQINKLRRGKNLPVILLRKTASTDDISLMPEVEGILTSAGGTTSHAAVLARKFDLAAVVGCSDMVIERDEGGEPCARIGDYVVTEGAVISIDGSTGLVYSGSCLNAGAESLA